MSSTIKKTTAAARNSNLLAGVQKRFPTVPNTQTFPVGGAILSIQQIVAELQPIVNAGAAKLRPRRLPGQAAVHRRTGRPMPKEPRSSRPSRPPSTCCSAPSRTSWPTSDSCRRRPRRPRPPRSRSSRSLDGRRPAPCASRSRRTEKKALKGALGATIEIRVPGTTAALPPAPAPSPTIGGVQATGASAAPGGTGSAPHT